MDTHINIYKPRFKKRYTVGRGAYSTVYYTKEGYIIKRNYVDKSTDFIGSVRELDILSRTKCIPYFVQLQGIIIGETPFYHKRPTRRKDLSPTPDSYLKTDKLWFILEPGTDDLFRIIHKRKKKNFTLYQIKRYMIQILLAVEYLHNSGIIHRDLKLSNILWKSDTDSIRLIDYGLSRFHCTDGSKTPDMCTANYRAPEIYLGYNYDYRCDVWSLGCILYELLSFKPFLRIKGSEDGLDGLLSRLPRECYENRNMFYESDCCKPGVLKRLRLLDNVEMYSSVGCDIKAMLIRCGYGKDDVLLDLLKRMLSITPYLRSSVTEVINHPFFDEVRDIIKEFRSKYYPIIRPNPFININNNISRKNISSLIIWYYKNRKLFRWYQHRILFQTMDICDRYMNISPNVNTTCLFYTSLYLSIKLLTTSESIPKFFSIIKNPHLKTNDFYHQCEELELDIIYRMGCLIYRHTLYDYIDHRSDLHDIEVYRLLQWYIDLDTVMGTNQMGITHRDLIKLYYRTRL
jgi:serine/threonine protein kinase